MAGNNLAVIDMISRSSVEIFENSNAFLDNISKKYSNEFAKEGAKIGTQLRIRLPNDYTVTNGPAASIQSTANQYTILTLSTQRHVDVGFNSIDTTLKLQDIAENIVKPSVEVLAGNIAATVMNGYTETQGEYNGTVFQGISNNISNYVANVDGGGTILYPTQNEYLTAGAIMTENSIPISDIRKVVNSPRTQSNVVNSLTGTFNPQSVISKQYMTGKMYSAYDLEWMSDTTVHTHTTGTWTNNTNVVSANNQSGLTILCSASTGTLTIGDIITFTGVNEVNRVTKADAGVLKQFVVTAAVAGSGTSISIYPALTPPVGGQNVQYQTVTASPSTAASNYINIVTSTNGGAAIKYKKNIAFAKDAITMATADMVMPPMKRVSRKEKNGISLRYLEDYIVGTDQLVSRLDCIFGWQVLRPEWGVVVASPN